jgi:ribosomal protein RSM22 (predicted rRNA methylase)
LQLPRYLSAAIEELTAGQQSGISSASAQLTVRYKRADFSAPALRSQADRLAYLTTRLPATFAALTRVFRELIRLAAGAEISTLLDLGAGPGTALFAAAEAMPELRRATLFEADAEWLHLGQQLAAQTPFPVVRSAEWWQRDLRSPAELPPYDIVVISYSLGELTTHAVDSVIEAAWKSAQTFLVLIEPGTVRGFGIINHARTALIGRGAEILAPCPHKNVCPMAEAGDWCHFAQRVERSSQHRRAKEASRGYEDEKFSYVIATRKSFPAAKARIVRHPQKHSGHINLELCTPDGLRQKTITRSAKQAYKGARHAGWGDEFPLQQHEP